MRMSPLPRLVLVAAVTLLTSANANAETGLRIDTNTVSSSSSASAPASSSYRFETVNREQVIAGMEASLLSLLGFEKRPNPQGSAHVPESLKKLQARQNTIGIADIAKRGIHARSANTVRSFPHVGECRFLLITHGERYIREETPGSKMSILWKNTEFFEISFFFI